MTSTHSLSKQKRRLSILFSLSIFCIIILLDIGFLSFKYFDYEKQELGRLSLQSQGIIKNLKENPNFLQDISQGKLPVLSPIMRRGNMNNIPGVRIGVHQRSIQMENFFIYNALDNKILFSPQKDNELYSSILDKIQSNINRGRASFEFNDTKYLFLHTPISDGINGVFFTESRMTTASMLTDIFIYLIGATLLSLAVYVVSSRFVDHTLSPVEKNMDQMEQFIHNAGHELKTPLSVIKSSLELMKLSKNYDAGIPESIDEINRMDRLIQALISLSTIENTEKIETIDIGEIITKLKTNLREKLEEKHISLEVITKKPLSIRANREYIEILLSNLLSNAIKYNKDNGEIIITLDQKNMVIQDTGIGIAKENIPHIFERFYRENEGRDENSFGIGLSLVKGIVDLYKGDITVESEKGIGTIFKITF